MIKSPLSYIQTIPGVTLEHLRAVDGRVQWQKDILRQKYEARQKRYADAWTLTKKRVVDLANRRKKDNLEAIAKNRARRDRFQFQLDNVKNAKFYRKLNRLAFFKNRDKKKVENIAQMKQAKLIDKRVNELKRYWTIFTRQKQSIEYNKTLIDKCLENKPKYNKTVEFNVYKETETKQEFIEGCTFNQPGGTTLNIEPETCGNFTDCSFRMKLLDRIENLRANFETCEQGTMFWRKTEPLWNRMSQCIDEIDFSIVDVKSITNKEDEDKQTNKDDITTKKEGLMQKIMLNDVDYHLSDKNIIELIKKAKELSEPDATAAEIIHLTRCIVEYEADVKTNVNHIVYGLYERGVFEFTKKMIAKKVFVDVRKTVDRLQHLNDDDVIPKKLIRTKNKIEVMYVVRELIDDVGGIYGPKFDRPIDDDPDYKNLTSEMAEDKMRIFLGNYDQHSGSQSIISETPFYSSIFPMDLRHKLFQDVNGTIDVFLEVAHQKIARFLAMSKVDRLAEFKRKSSGMPDTVTVSSVFRICRKIAKLSLNMFPSENRAKYNFEATTNAYAGLVTKRTSHVEYNRRSVKPPEIVDLQYYRKLFDHSNPRNKTNVQHDSFFQQ